MKMYGEREALLHALVTLTLGGGQLIAFTFRNSIQSPLNSGLSSPRTDTDGWWWNMRPSQNKQAYSLVTALAELRHLGNNAYTKIDSIWISPVPTVRTTTLAGHNWTRQKHNYFRQLYKDKRQIEKRGFPTSLSQSYEMALPHGIKRKKVNPLTPNDL
jgi:hypothetical protein